MALPRWVPSNKVDSAAALLAYENWYSRILFECQDEKEAYDKYGVGLYGLDVILHYPYSEVFPTGPGFTGQQMRVNPRPCSAQDPPCERCTTERGGYMFRWFSVWWAEDYIRFSRPGSWKPGDPEAPEGDSRHLL